MPWAKVPKPCARTSRKNRPAEDAMPRLPRAFEDDKARLIASLRPDATLGSTAGAERPTSRAGATSRGRAATKPATKKTAARSTSKTS